MWLVTPCSFFIRFTLRVRDPLEDLFGFSSPFAHGVFSSEKGFMSLCRSRYFIWRSNWSRSLYNLFHPDERNFFIQKRDIRNIRDGNISMTFQCCWIADRRHERHFLRFRLPLPLPSLPPIFCAVSLLFQFFPSEAWSRAKDSRFLKQKNFTESGLEPSDRLYKEIWYFS